MEFLLQYALKFIGVPYKYGGENPLEGFDCSGLVQDLLVAGGVFPFAPRGHKRNAQMIFDELSKVGSQGKYGAGAIAFYGKDSKSIDHVGFCLDAWLLLEAAGGHADCLDLSTAVHENAFVKLRPIKYRVDFLCVVKPFYNKIGML